jgi:hypothetical protein
MTRETWRVVVEGGRAREVSTMQRSATMWGAHFVGDTSYNGGYGPSARAAVLAACGSAFVAAVEILAPGELSAEERVAAERARCAAVCREVAAEYEGHAGAVARQCAEAVERGPSAPGVG